MNFKGLGSMFLVALVFLGLFSEVAQAAIVDEAYLTEKLEELELIYSESYGKYTQLNVEVAAIIAQIKTAEDAVVVQNELAALEAQLNSALSNAIHYQSGASKLGLTNLVADYALLIGRIENLKVAVDATQADLQAFADSQDNTDNPDVGGDTEELTPEEQEYEQLQEEFENLDDDYQNYRKKYRDAVQDKDSSYINKYENKLKDLQDDLEDLADDVDNLIDDAKDADNDDLQDNSEDLLEDVENLQDKIDNLLAEDEDSISKEDSYVPAPVKSQPAEDTTVVIEPFKFEQFPASQVTAGLTWSEIRPIAWIVGGVVTLVAILIFLVAMLLRR
ncbi:MAG TPA: hypothetical protein VJC39_02455 [Candidatus Nanoarchaeia archaeon]|nr:hypothetical protein [Candidatus Nanoarchaeia archaeon]